MGEFSCQSCFRSLIRVILFVVNTFVAVLGVLVLAVGIYASVNGGSYFELAGSSGGAFTRVPILMIVVGVFVLLMGVVGTVGSLFAGTIGGRIILGLYGFVLALLVICEIGGGIAAGVERDQLNQGFTDSLNDTFSKYYSDKSVGDTWNNAQKALKCCGNNNYTDYYKLFGNVSIPDSCCNASKTDCKNLTMLTPQYIYPQGCGSKVRDIVSHNLGVVAGVAITFGFLQVIGVVVSCFVAIAAGRCGCHEEGKYEVV